MKRINAVLLGGLIGAGPGLLIAGSEPPLETVGNVNLARYAGRWYEIARYPNRFERKCDHDVTAEYSVKADGDIRVVTTCVTQAGKSTQSGGTAKVVDSSTLAKL